MADKSNPNVQFNEWLDGYLSVVEVLIGVVALRTGVLETLVEALSKLQPLETQENLSDSDKLFREGKAAAISHIQDSLKSFNSLSTQKHSQTSKSKILIQATPEELMANILVLQLSIGLLSKHLNLSEALTQGLTNSKISYGDIDTSNPNNLAMTEKSPEIQSALKNLRQFLC